MTLEDHAKDLVERIAKTRPKGRRLLAAIAGPPGSGKSTLAEAVVEKLGEGAALMPMDGFHLDDRLLEPRGLLSRKGAPETFDFDGFERALRRVAAEPAIVLPIFDRTREIAIAGAQEIAQDTKIVVVEGNYLCFSEAPWDRLHPLWDVSAFLDVPEDELERRLVERWLGFGFDPDTARKKARANDIPNARRVVVERGAVDMILPWDSAA